MGFEFQEGGSPWASTPTDPRGIWVEIFAVIHAEGWAKTVFTVLIAGNAVVFCFSIFVFVGAIHESPA